MSRTKKTPTTKAQQCRFCMGSRVFASPESLALHEPSCPHNPSATGVSLQALDKINSVSKRIAQLQRLRSPKMLLTANQLAEWTQPVLEFFAQPTWTTPMEVLLGGCRPTVLSKFSTTETKHLCCIAGVLRGVGATRRFHSLLTMKWARAVTDWQDSRNVQVFCFLCFRTTTHTHFRIK